MVAKKKTGTLTSSFLPKRALVLLIVMCALVTAFFVLPKNQNSLSSTVLPPPTTDVPATTEPSPTTSEPLSTTNCPDANITLEWTANESTTNASTNPVGYKLSYSSATGSNGSVSISGRTTTTATVTLTAAPDPGVNYTFSITAVNAEGIESIPSTPVKETITCDENGKIIITPTPTSNHLACNSSGDCAFVDGAGSNECEAVKTKDPECASDPYVTPPPYNPFPEGVPRHNMCDYYEKECKPVSGAGASSCTNNTQCECGPGQVMGETKTYAVERSDDGMVSWYEYIPADVGEGYNLQGALDAIRNGPNPPASVFLRFKIVTTQGCVSSGSSLGSSVLGGNTNTPSRPSFWSRLIVYISSLFSSSEGLKSNITTPPPSDTGRPSQPVGPGGIPDSGMRNVQVVLKGISSGDEVFMSSNLGVLTLQGGDPFKASFPVGTTLSFTAITGPDSTFTGWTGGCATIVGKTCSFVVKRANGITATFALKKNTLTAQVSPLDGGTVTSSYEDISCGGGKTSCTKEYPLNTFESLVATPVTGATFVSWQGCTRSEGNVCILNMDSAKSVTATFKKANSTLTVSRVGTGTGTISGNATTYLTDSTATITATPDVGSTFTGWTGCTSVSGNTCIILMNDNKTVTATFTVVPAKYSLTVNKAGTGSGITSTITSPYTAGSTVTVTAKPAAGSTFAGWTGCSSVSGSTCYVLMTMNKTITATFTLIPTYSVTSAKTGTGTGTISGTFGISSGFTAGTFPSGSMVTFTATPSSTSTFTRWTGCTTVSGTTCTVSMTSNKAITAEFAKKKYTLSINLFKNNYSDGVVWGSIKVNGILQSSFSTSTLMVKTYTYGDIVYVKASANGAGSFFTGFDGACTGSGTCTITMDRNRSIIANFTK